MTFRNTSGAVNFNPELVFDAGPKAAASLSIAVVRHQLTRIPSTRFYGSKRRLLPWFLDILWPLKFDTVLDVFGGTSCVSSMFMQMGKAVTFHDGLLCNQISARALLTNRAVAQIDLKKHLRNIKPITGFITSKFSGKYFTHEENRWLDGFATYVAQIENSFERDVILHCVFQACLRKRPFNAFHRANLSLRLNKVERTFGNATTWAKSFPHHTCDAFEELCLAPRGAGSVSLLTPRDVCAIPAGYDLVYIDPPYLRKDRSPERYVRMYHFLEGLSRYSVWERLIDATSSLGSLPDNYYVRDWEQKNAFLDNLRTLVRAHARSIVVMSYVRGGFPSTLLLRQLFDTTFAKTSIYTKKLPHALSRRNTAEVLLVGIPR